ncbi:MAG TPA: hypothetical protein VF266_11855 [Thermoanaerobaculia bacterium]
MPSLPHQLDELREVVFVAPGTSRLLAIFTSRENAPPHNGAHRADGSRRAVAETRGAMK